MEIYWLGGLYASQLGRRLLTVVRDFFFPQLVIDLIAVCCAICADQDGCSRVCVFPAGFGSNFRIMVGSASGPGSTFKAFLGSARVRVFGPVKTSSLYNCFCDLFIDQNIKTNK